MTSGSTCGVLSGAHTADMPAQKAERLLQDGLRVFTAVLQDCPWLAKCPAGSASADISYGGFFALFFILGLLWLAYVAFSAYIK